MGFRAWRVSCLGGLGFRAYGGSGFRAYGVQGLGFRVEGKPCLLVFESPGVCFRLFRLVFFEPTLHASLEATMC